MFGKGLPVRERFSNFRMDYIDFSGCTEDERYSDRLTYDGRWENNLYQFFRLVSPKITRDLPRPFKLVGMKREDDTPQHKAVREALTNSIIHSDVFLSGSILRIEKHDDRLCFRNPGTLKLSLEEIYEGGNSKARNPKMQDMLRMIGYGENLGCGFPKILDAWKEAKWDAPILEDMLSLGEVRLTLPVPFNSRPKVVNTIKEGLTPRQQLIYDAIKENGEVTAKSLAGTLAGTLARTLAVSPRTIERELTFLKDSGYIKKEGKANKGVWVILK